MGNFRMSLQVIFFLLVVAGLATICACSEVSREVKIKKLVEDYFTAYEHLDYQGYIRCRSRLGITQPEEYFTKKKKLFPGPLRTYQKEIRDVRAAVLAAIEQGNIELTDETAKMNIQDLSLGPVVWVKLEFVRENDEWKISRHRVGKKVLKDPQPFEGSRYDMKEINY